MTYNFDPDTWYDNEILVLKHQLKLKNITNDQFNIEMEMLEKRHEEMWDRLNRSYQVFPNKKNK